MINKKLQNALNDQIQAEIYSAHLYLQMSAYFNDTDLPGFANWMLIQYQEESQHAIKFFNYIHERGEKAEIKEIPAPPKTFKSALHALESTLAHEQEVTKRINNLYQLALDEKDFALQSFLRWFIDEQVEEEASASEIIGKLRRIPEDAPAMLLLDNELGQRTLTPADQESNN